MVDDKLLLQKFATLPEALKEEALHYIEYLLFRLKGPKPEINEEPRIYRKAGFAKGTFIMHEDFDGPLDDFKDYM